MTCMILHFKRRPILSRNMICIHKARRQKTCSRRKEGRSFGDNRKKRFESYEELQFKALDPAAVRTSVPVIGGYPLPSPKLVVWVLE